MIGNMTKWVAVLGLSATLVACNPTTDTTEVPEPVEPVTVTSANYGANAQACLVKAMYFEARGTGRRGMRAVGEVILNRSDSSRFPSGACNVLNQYYNGTCQFSFICDGIADNYREPAQKELAADIAKVLLNSRGSDITGGALFFHATRMSPGSWFNSLHRIGTFGGNIFYK